MYFDRDEDISNRTRKDLEKKALIQKAAADQRGPGGRGGATAPTPQEEGNNQ